MRGRMQERPFSCKGRRSSGLELVPLDFPAEGARVDPEDLGGSPRSSSLSFRLIAFRGHGEDPSRAFTLTSKARAQQTRARGKK